MKRFLICLLLLSSLATAQAQEQENKAPQQPPANVHTAPLEFRMVAPTQELSGIVDFDRVSQVVPTVDGNIEDIPVNAGDQLHKGDLIARLDTAFIERDLDILTRRQQQAQIAIEQTQRNLERLERLYAEQSASEKTYDDQRFALRSSKAELEQLRAEQRKLELRLERSQIQAPFDGLVLERLKSVGESASPGTPLVTLASTGSSIVRVNIPEELLPLLKPRHQLEVSIASLDRRCQGTLQARIPIADMRTKTVPIKIQIPFSAGMIKNLSARIWVPSSPEQRLAVVSRDALVKSPQGTIVYSIQDGAAKPVPVEPLAYMGPDVAITSPMPLKEGMPIVIEGNRRLRPDQPVRQSGAAE